jgi:uncharacterized phage-associated protein
LRGVILKGKSKYYYENSLVWQIEPVTETIYVMNKKNESSYLFTNVEKEIWLAINERRSVIEITNTLVEIYDISSEILRKDIIKFISRLLDEELIYEIN